MKRSCPVCNKEPTDMLFSINKIYCFNCEEFYDFKLKLGQKSIHNKGLKGERINSNSNK